MSEAVIICIIQLQLSMVLHESDSKSGINAVTVTLRTLVGVLYSYPMFCSSSWDVCVITSYLYKKLAESGSQTTPAYGDRQLDSDERDIELEQNMANSHFRRENISGN